jgi:hypothetical protein
MMLYRGNQEESHIFNLTHKPVFVLKINALQAGSCSPEGNSSEFWGDKLHCITKRKVQTIYLADQKMQAGNC